MSTDYTHFSNLAFTNLFARGPDGSEVQLINSSGAFVNVTIAGNLTITGSLNAARVNTTFAGSASSVTIKVVSAGLGIYRAGVKQLGFAAGAINIATITTAALLVAKALTVTGAATASNLSGTNTGDNVNASSSASGIITTGAQTLAGNKTFLGIMGVGGTVGSASILNVGEVNPITTSTQTAMRTAMVATAASTGGVYGVGAAVTTAASSFTAALRAQFYSGSSVAKGAGSAITRDIGMYMDVPAQGTNNALISDNLSFTGNYAINIASTNASVFAGSVTASNLSGTNTGDNVNASSSAAGIVSTGTQSFAGSKTFTTPLAGSNVVSASSSAIGVVSISAQTLGGNKTLKGILTVQAGSGTQNASVINRYVNAGNGTGLVGLRIGNSGASQGDMQLFYTNASATGAPKTTLVHTPRNNADSGNTDCVRLSFAKNAGNNGGNVTLEVASTAAALITALSISSSKTATFAGQLIGQGTTTNDNASSGQIGEIIESSPGSAALGTSATWTNYTSIPLTAGDWDISGIIHYDPLTASTTSTTCQMAISVNSGTTTTDHVAGSNWIYFATTGAAGLPRNGTIAAYRLSLSGSSVVYLKTNATYTIATPKIMGRISARRSR